MLFNLYTSIEYNFWKYFVALFGYTSRVQCRIVITANLYQWAASSELFILTDNKELSGIQASTWKIYVFMNHLAQRKCRVASTFGIQRRVSYHNSVNSVFRMEIHLSKYSIRAYSDRIYAAYINTKCAHLTKQHVVFQKSSDINLSTYEWVGITVYFSQYIFGWGNFQNC